MKDGSEVAVKRLPVERCKESGLNEAKILCRTSSNNSPFLVKYRGFHINDNFIYLAVDLCEETLNDLVKSFDEDQLQKRGPQMIKEILIGLQYLHAQRILHRDLKPVNILVDIEGHMKLADFGISRVLKEDETTVVTDVKGTDGWLAAEVYRAMEKREKSPFKKRSDIQVAGMIAFFILTKGEHPFGSSKAAQMKNILDGKSVNLSRLRDRKAYRFVSRLIKHDIKKRPYADEALKDSFFDSD